MKKLCLITATIAGLASGPAMSADLAMPAPPPVLGWTGCYIGAAGGFAFGDSNAKSDGTPVGTPINITGNYHVSGGIAGGTAGCNLFQTQNWVFGIESDLSWADKTGSGSDQPPFFNPSTSNTSNEQWLSTDRVRIGYALANNWLVYATGG